MAIGPGAVEGHAMASWTIYVKKCLIDLLSPDRETASGKYIKEPQTYF